MSVIRWIRFLVGCLILGIMIVLIFNFIKFLFGGFSSSLTSPVINLESLKQNISLEKNIGKSLNGTSGSYAIAVKNLKTGEEYYIDEHKRFEAGSLYKLWVMAEAFNQIKKGTLKEDEVLTKDVKYLNEKFHISEEDAELKEGEVSIIVSQALNQMITISHNYAALLLTERIKLSNVAKFLKDKGFKESEVGLDGGSPNTTAFDIATFFEKLYNGQLADGDYTAKMLELLRAQQLNNKLPKNLPSGTTIAHKTGEIFSFTHDGGIVFNSKGDYVIVVLSESTSPAGAEERIASISEAVYKYFNR